MSLETPLSSSEKPETEETPSRTERSIKNEEIAELRDPMKHLLGQLRDKIDGGEYHFLIGDDASGRIPTLLFDKIVKTIYKERGFQTPQTLFFAGGHDRGRYPGMEGLHQPTMDKKNAEMTREVAEAIHHTMMKHKHDSKDELSTVTPKALVITETIVHGTGLQMVTKTLKKNLIPYDVATIGLLPSPAHMGYPYTPAETRKKWISKELEGDIYYGQDRGPSIGDAHHLGGVVKDPAEIRAHSLKEEATDKYNKRGTLERLLTYRKAKQEQHMIQEEINTARDDVNILSDELLGWYHEHHDENP